MTQTADADAFVSREDLAEKTSVVYHSESTQISDLIVYSNSIALIRNRGSYQCYIVRINI